MLNTRFTLQFHFKKPKGPKTETLPIFLRISAAGRRVEFSTRRSWDPQRWDSVNGRASGSRDDARSLNAYLAALQTRVYEVYQQLILDREEITADALKDALHGGKNSKRKLIPIFENHNEQVAALIGKDYAPGTLDRYKKALDHTVSFLQSRYNVDDITIDKLNFEFVLEFEFWLKTARSCSHNTTLKYISNLRKVINICVRKGWLTRDPFFGYKMTKREVIREVLTEDEISLIARKEFGIARLDMVKDLFIFSCYTGLAYVDMKNLTWLNVSTGIDDELWIFTKRQKTGTESRIPLLPQAIAILEKYKHNPICLNKGTLLPVPSNQNMNAYLKEVGDLSGVTKSLTCHMARHTFATTVALENDVPMETVSKILGHKYLKTTQHYAKVQDKKVSNDMQKLRNKLTAHTNRL
jgi:integrase